MEFQKLLNKIEEFKSGVDYTCILPIVISDKYESIERYSIHSSQLKKAARQLMFNSDTEDGGFFRVGTEIEGKWYEYEKGDNNRPDHFSIKVISSKQREESQRRKEQRKHDREKLEKDRKEFEEKKKQGVKCTECGKTSEGKDYWEWIGTGDKIYCMSCSDKLPKVSETELKKRNLNALKRMKIEQEQIKLEALNSKLQNSTNSAEKTKLKIEIEEAENRIKELKSKDKSKNNSSLSPVHPSKGYGKIIFSVIAIFSVVILASILVVKTRKQRRKINP